MDKICILHTADIHLGSAAETHLSGNTASIPVTRQGELLAVFSDLVRRAGECGASAVLLAGDLSDVGILPPSECAFVLDTIASHPKVRFFLVPGNHDRMDGGESCFSSSAVLPGNLTVFGSAWETCYLTPEITVTGRTLPREKDPFSMPALPADCFNIVLLHGLLSAEQTFGGADSVLPRRAFIGKNIDYLALGHLHTFSLEKLDGRCTACYSGTPAGRGFDECGEKGWAELTLADGKRPDVRFVPSGARTLHTVDVDVSTVPTGIAAAENAVLSALGELPARDIVRVRLTGEDDLTAERGISYLKKRLAERFFYAELTDARTVRMDLEQYRGDISLRGAFVREVLSDDSLSEEEKTEILRCGLGALSGREA